MFKRIEFGIKISIKNFDLLPEIYLNTDIIDFIEIILDPKFKPKDIEIIKNLKLPYAIHFPNSNNGIDFGDKRSEKQNNNYIRKINQNYEKLMDLSPICYIIHPESGDIGLSIENIKKLKIKPLALENMPKTSLIEGELLGYDSITLEKYFKEIESLEFCLDINHAIKASISKGIGYLDMLKELINLREPILFHIAGGNFNVEVDEHLHLDAAEYDVYKIKQFLFDYEKSIKLTFETPRNYKKKIEDDLRNMRYFINA